jgi:hypothetical protein
LPAAGVDVVEKLDDAFKAGIFDQPRPLQDLRFDGQDGQGEDMQGIPIDIADCRRFLLAHCLLASTDLGSARRRPQNGENNLAN